MAKEQRVVDNRVFLLGLDELYRKAMKKHEATSLLECAQETATLLSVAPVNVPIEGYYSNSEELTKYFLLMRTLQQISRGREDEVLGSEAFLRLKQVAESPLFGLPYNSRYLLAAGRDSLSVALEQTDISDWAIATVTEAAYQQALESQDISLVGLASLARDSVVLTALRESTVLYSWAVAGSAFFPPTTPEYVWQVDNLLQTRAKQFVDTFNTLLDESLPEPHPRNAESFWKACKPGGIVGRCVRIGFDDSVLPNRQYHWAIVRESTEIFVRDFWDTEIWTNERFRDEQLRH
ncbi:MAG: hypothetical protein AAGM36_16250 [Cyanobacteria bacterium J06597_1]